MAQDLNRIESQRPVLFYNLGDIAYSNGERHKYYKQFYKPYQEYNFPILGIPGDCDGDPVDVSQTSLDGWTRYFMTARPHVNGDSQDTRRITLSLPNVYYTLVAPFANIIGLYTNVPEQGEIDPWQQEWLAEEMASAPLDKALIVAMHHSIYSFDDREAGSKSMGASLQKAINESRRVPNLVVSSQARNYQLIEKDVIANTFVPMALPFVVAGSIGYPELDVLQEGVRAGHMDRVNGAKLIYADAENHGYLTLSVDAKFITGKFTTANPGQDAVESAHTFTYSAAAITLPVGASARL